MKHIPQLVEPPSPIPDHPEGGVPVIEAVVRHIERHLGPIDFVLHERRSHLVHIDVHHVPPGPGRRFHTLVTSGMSARAMTVPAGAENLAYAELFLLLPLAWDVSTAWPVGLLRALAHYPHDRDTWLGRGHTVRNGEPPHPFGGGIPFCACLLTHPVRLGGQLAERRLRGRSIRFYQVFPLFFEEIRFALLHGTDALLARFAQYHLSDVVDPGRRNACRFYSGNAIPCGTRCGNRNA